MNDILNHLGRPVKRYEEEYVDGRGSRVVLRGDGDVVDRKRGADNPHDKPSDLQGYTKVFVESTALNALVSDELNEEEKTMFRI